MPPFHIYTGSRPANVSVQVNYQGTVSVLENQLAGWLNSDIGDLQL